MLGRSLDLYKMISLFEDNCLQVVYFLKILPGM